MRILLLLALVLGACTLYYGSDGSHPIHGDPDAALPRCEQIAARLNELVTNRGTCDVDADCALEGGQISQYPSCNCTPYMLACEGLAVGKNMPGYSELVSLEQEYVARGCSVWGSACDCAPGFDVACTEDHRCIVNTTATCWPEYPDAGVPPDAPH